MTLPASLYDAPPDTAAKGAASLRRPLLLLFMVTLRFFDMSKILKYYFKILLTGVKS